MTGTLGGRHVRYWPKRSAASATLREGGSLWPGRSRRGACPSCPSRLASTAAPAIPAVVTALAARPRAMAVAGALTIAFSAILVKQAAVSPSTAAIFRCAYAVPVLGGLAWWEERRLGPRSGRDRALAALAGVFFSADLICWHHAIEDVGAGLATVLGNLQVAFVRWWRGSRSASARPPGSSPRCHSCFSGVVLVSGVLEDGAYGANPEQGVVYGLATGLAYTGFILVLRAGSGEQQRVAGPLFDATFVAAVVSVAAGR